MLSPSHLFTFRALRSFDRSPRPSFVRLPFATGSRSSDTGRPFVRVNRASRDLTYFFTRLPLDRVSWAFPYLSPGLFAQLVISRSSELQAALDPIAARFAWLHRPGMGRVVPQPNPTGAASSEPSQAAAAAPAPAEGPQTKEQPFPLGRWLKPRIARKPRAQVFRRRAKNLR